MTRNPDAKAFELGLKYITPATIALILMNLTVFVWQQFSSDLQEFILTWGFDSQKVWQGEVWRVVTAVFVHADAEHFLGNVIMLYIAGIALEHGVGVAKTIIIFIVAGVMGNIVGLFFGDVIIHIGASGGVFGLIGALVSFLFFNQDRYYVRDKRIAVIFLVWALYSFATATISPEIDNTAHIVGFVLGAGIAWLF